MKALITGGCGFVGVNLAGVLLANGHSIRVLDNLVLGKREFLGDLDVEFIEGDLRSKDDVAGAVDGMDVVIHLAADTRVIPSIENPVFNFENNVIGTFNLIEAMRQAKVTRLVNASTGGAILGEVDPPVHEGMVPQPISPYGASKLMAEGYLSAYSACYGLKAASLRFSNVYGPRSFHKGSVVAHFIKQIMGGQELVVYGDGSQARDYIFVEDLCQGIEACFEQGATGVYQLGTGVATSLNTLIATLRDVVPGGDFKVRYEGFRAGEIKHTYGDVSKARNELGFTASTNLRDGLQRTWDWFEANRAVFGLA
jgi:UDP-glucose 4-epimerase